MKDSPYMSLELLNLPGKHIVTVRKFGKPIRASQNFQKGSNTGTMAMYLLFTIHHTNTPLHPCTYFVAHYFAFLVEFLVDMYTFIQLIFNPNPESNKV